MAFIPDLDGAREMVAGILPDTCIVRRRGEAGDVLNEVTLKLTPGEVATEVYTGACAVGSRTEIVADEAGGAQAIRVWSGLWPFDAPEFLPGDEVEMVTSTYDATLPGKFFSVTGVGGGSFLVGRTLNLKALGPISGRP